MSTSRLALGCGVCPLWDPGVLLIFVTFFKLPPPARSFEALLPGGLGRQLWLRVSGGWRWARRRQVVSGGEAGWTAVGGSRPAPCCSSDSPLPLLLAQTATEGTRHVSP